MTISGHSTALYSTWYFIEELALLLDCGDGACAALQQKSRKVKTVACSHADRDHLNGLPHFLQLNVREHRLPRVLYPRDCGSFPALRDFLDRFDRRDIPMNEWIPMAPGRQEDLGKSDARIECFVNRHIEAAPGEVKSLSYRVVRYHRKLKPELQGLSQEEIAQRHQRGGNDAVTFVEPEVLLIFSADTPIEPPSYWGNGKVLIHEATFLHRDDAGIPADHMSHSALDDVIEMASELDLEALIVGHFSTRYRPGEVRQAVRSEARRCRPKFPVFSVQPGETRRDILRGEPLWGPG